MDRGRLILLLLVAFLVVVLLSSIAGTVWLLHDADHSGSDGEGSVLVVEISGAMPEQPSPDDPLAALRGAQPWSILEVDSALRKAAADEDIRGVLLQPGGLSIGYGKVEELRQAVLRFRQDSGKPVTCFMEQAGNKEYLLATSCDTIYMAPEGFFLVNGLHLGVTYYKGVFEKLGVEPEFTRAGRYKSAVESYTRSDMSEASREMMGALADDLYGHLVRSIANARGLDEERVRQLIDDPPLTPGRAMQAGLVDGLLYRDQLDDALAGRPVESVAVIDPDDVPRQWAAGGIGVDKARIEAEAAASQLLLTAAGDDDSAADPGDEAGTPAVAEGVDADNDYEVADVDRVSMSEYRKVRPGTLGLGDGPEIAVIFAEGQIVSGSGGHGTMGGRMMGSDTIARAIRKARKDDDIKAIVLRIDSPGGSALASDIIWREVQRARAVKPVIASMSDLAASGGYYIAMGADAIVAQPTTITGSIGVFAGKMSLGGLYEKVGLTTDRVQRGAMAGLFSSTERLGDKGMAKLSEYVDAFYATFITKAAQGRHTTPEVIHASAQGRVWAGASALDRGLVDTLGSFRTALALAKEKAGIDGEVKLVLYPHQKTMIEQLLDGRGVSLLSQRLDARAALANSLGAESAEGLRAAIEAAPLLSSGLPVLMAPYHVEVR